MSIRNKEYLELLKHAFDENKFVDFIVDLLNLDSSNLNRDISKISNLSKQYENNIQYYKFIANYYDGMNNIGIFIIKLNDTTSTKARSMQRNFAATLLSKYNLDASLIAFYSDKETSWRLSFVKKELSFSDKGMKEELTPAKRYSYLVGENESVHTAQEFLLKLLDIDDRKITLDDIEKQFDVEKVTKKFFEEYKEKYLELKEFLDKNEDFQTEAKNCDFDSIEFAKKLMGQIVFLYFLQKKGWLGVQLIPGEISIEEYNELLSKCDSVSQNLIKNYFEINDDKYIVIKTKLRMSELQEDIVNLTNIFKGTKYDMPWGTGKKDFIRSIFNQAQKEHKNFFDDYLEYFFYKGLNEKRENQYFPLFNCKIPFLNGGLFEPLNNYRWSSAHFEINNSVFSNDYRTGILDFLDLYNFTIDEEEPLEKEIAVDPEMLGKIFENLLDVNDRKSKGAFYTPREIVHYMCQEGLANYLVNKVNLNYDETIQFIKYSDLISQYDWEQSINDSKDFIIGKTLFENLINIDDALINVKIADPAVGSGAFPLGMLNEIVKLRTNIQTYILIKNELGLINLDELNDTKHLETDIYKMKLQTIENSIYAVDIESSAVDIAKLRLWLSLIVDYPNDQEPQPLPNLDCKIMQGNSLLDEYKGIQLFNDKILNNFLKNYKRNLDKKNIKEVNIQFNLLDNQIDIGQQMKQLITYQTELFKTSDSRKKKELKEHIEDVQLGIISKSINDSKKEMEISNLMKKKQKPWFIWKLEFFDVFKENGGFDIVIGNPPYIDSESMTNESPNLRKDYAIKYNFAKGNWDIYIIFFELAYNLLNEKGNMIFITPDKWVSKPFGDELRKNLYKNINNILVAGRGIFESAKVDSIVTSISKIICDTIIIKNYVSKTQETVNKRVLKEPYRLDMLFSKHLDLILKINRNATSLKDKFFVKTESACATSDAYLLKKIIKDNTFNLEKEYYKVINTGTIIPFGNLYGIKEMTYLKDKYLHPIVSVRDFESEFHNKYSTMVNCKKIILKGLNLLDGFIDFKGDILPAKTTLVIKSNSEKNLKIILGFLQSKIVAFYINETYSSSSYNGGITFTKEMIDNIPIPKMTNENELELLNIVENILNGINKEEYICKLNNFINNLYNLQYEDIKLLN